MRFLAILARFWEAKNHQKIEKNRTRSQKSEKKSILGRVLVGGRPPKGFWKGLGGVLGEFWKDFNRFLGKFWEDFESFWESFGIVLGGFNIN